ncbi:MAG: hypothetical protein CMJ44_00665 [Pimelobacter sp.]|nr:hypothetical protein [Pimelobacter sp.]
MSGTDVIGPTRREEIADLAEDVAGDAVPVDPDGVLRSQRDVSLAYGSFGDAYDGLIERRDGRFWVYCNEARTGGRDSPRARFTLAHEAGHYFLDEHRNALLDGRAAPHPSRADYTSNELVEREADLFASHLLMPTAPFARRMKKAGVGAPAVLALAREFGTSVTSAAIRWVSLVDHSCVVVKWGPDGYGWRWASREAWSGRYTRTVQDASALPRDSATALALRGASARSGFVEAGTTASAWFDYVRAGGSRDEILMEQAVSLGAFGVLTVLFPEALVRR